MILVTGGRASGKRTFAMGLGFSEDEVAIDAHELVRDCDDVAALVGRLREKSVVTCDEVGSGIVPLDAQERRYRDQVGRMASSLAEGADAVVRMVCGIPVVLKGDPWN